MSSDVIPLRVAVRSRPLIERETDEGCDTCLTFVSGEPQLILGKNRSFTYDYVFSPQDPQAEVYDMAVQPLIKHIFAGYNATVLAYGQTGSGKTFTMGGGYEDSLKMDPEKMGVIPRIVQEVFSGIDERDKYEYTMKVTYLEIINEELQDLLLSVRKDSLSIREENGEIKIPGLRNVTVRTVHDTMRLLEQGCSNRTTAATAMNSTSSRSHAIFTVYIEQRNKEDVNDFWKAKLQLVDLAGSERIKKTRAEGERLKEGININRGLLSLGNVISALGDESQKRGHIPYRDSKLTRILQDSLGGNSHTLMIACVSPADSNTEETLNTLRYADRARKIKNKPVVNWDPQMAEIMRLKDVVHQLTMKLIHHGITDISSSTTDVSSKTHSSSNSETLKVWMDKCKALEAENASLASELKSSVDQASNMCAKAIKMEMKCDRLKSRLHEFEAGVGVDFDLLSSSLAPEQNSVIAEQLDKLKSFVDQFQTSGTTEETVDTVEDDEVEDEDDGSPASPEAREVTLGRAKMNKELQELNKILEKKEKLANQMSQNDGKMAEMKAQYEYTMKSLEDDVSTLQKERENLSTALEDAKTNSAAGKVSEKRRKRLQELECQISDLRKKMTEQKKLLKLKDNSDKQVSKLSHEIMALKQQRVSLMKQMKEDSDKYRKLRQQKDKEVLQLQQKDRKRQFEIQKQKRDNQRIQAVLHRKSEEAAAANRRLKDALSKQKCVLEERNQKFEKCDNTSIGNRVRKWLSHELDVKVGVMEAKYHRESLLKDRKMLAEELKTLKESLDDDAPPSKKMAWMDDSGQKCETSFKEEQTKEKIENLKHQIELRNVQIADLQQKIFDADQEGKGKSTHDNLRTMMEAKIAIKWLLEQSVSFKADNNRIRLEVAELKDTLDENGTDNSHYIEELEHDLEEIKKTHASTIIKLRREHQKEIQILLTSAKTETSDADIQKRLDDQSAEIRRLSELNRKLRKDHDTMEKHLTKFMYTDKSVALMPEMRVDDDVTESRSPFLAPRPKPKCPTPATPLDDFSEGEEGEDADEEDNPGCDPDWQKTPRFNRIVDRPRKSRGRRTDLFKQPEEFRKSDGRGCGCRGNCSTKRCVCRKGGQFCEDLCKCLDCDNKEVQMPQSTTSDNDTSDTDMNEVPSSELPEILPSTSNEENTISSSLNSTFNIQDTEPAATESTSNPSQTLNSTFDMDDQKAEIPVKKAVISHKPPLKLTKQRSNVGRTALSKLSSGDNSLRSSDEFEKPMRKSVSAGNIRKKTSTSHLAKKISAESSVLLEEGLKKKRKLHNKSESFFNPVE